MSLSGVDDYLQLGKSCSFQERNSLGTMVSIRVFGRKVFTTHQRNQQLIYYFLYRSICTKLFQLCVSHDLFSLSHSFAVQTPLFQFLHAFIIECLFE